MTTRRRSFAAAGGYRVTRNPPILPDLRRRITWGERHAYCLGRTGAIDVAHLDDPLPDVASVGTEGGDEAFEFPAGFLHRELDFLHRHGESYPRTRTRSGPATTMAPD